MSNQAQADAGAGAVTGWPRCGVFSYGFERGQLQPLVEGLVQEGLSAVQLGSGLLDAALADPAEIAEMNRQLRANDIAVAGLAGYRNLVAPDPEVRRDNLEYLKRCLQLAADLGAPTVATQTGTRHPEDDWLPDPANGDERTWSLLFSALDELLTVAERIGVSLALEGFVNNVVRDLDDLDRVVDRFPTPALQIVLDPYNYISRDLLPTCAEVAATFLQRYASRFTLAHLKDVGAEGAERDTPEFGLGVFPQALYLEFLRTRRPDLPLIFEHLPFEHVPAVKKQLQALIGTMR